MLYLHGRTIRILRVIHLFQEIPLSNITLFTDSPSANYNIKNKNNPSDINVKIQNIIRQEKTTELISNSFGSQAIEITKKIKWPIKQQKIQYHLFKTKNLKTQILTKNELLLTIKLIVAKFGKITGIHRSQNNEKLNKTLFAENTLSKCSGN